MSTLLVSLDNPHARPSMALYPEPEDSTGALLVELVREHLGRYSSTSYLREFVRTSLYPSRRAPEGQGRLASDKDALSQVEVLAAQIGARDVVLLGLRVVRAFNALHGENLDWLQCRVTADGPRRWWAVPHPSTRNRRSGHWYSVPENRAAAGKLLASLRTTTRRLEVANG